MLQARLSKLPKDLLIKILLKVKEEKFYKLKIREEYKKHTFYVKATSRNNVIEKIRNNKEIRSVFMELWKNESEYSDICLYINVDTLQVERCNYRCMNHINLMSWSFFKNFDNYEVLLEEQFDNLFYEYMGDEDRTTISIEEIKIIPKIQL